jgi:hypothetical protein
MNFIKEIANKIVPKVRIRNGSRDKTDNKYIECGLYNIRRHSFFNITDYERIIRSQDKEADNKLISLYKLLSPAHLLKLRFANDSNSLNQNFYSKLLYIMARVQP